MNTSMTYERSATLTPLTDAQMEAIEGGRFHWHNPLRDIARAVVLAAAGAVLAAQLSAGAA
jgi:hypothetical protein